MVVIMKLLRVLSILIVEVAFIRLTSGLEKGTKSFIMANINAKNVIREFEHYVGSPEEDLKHFMSQNRTTLFDFTTMMDVNNWLEISDTVRTVGKSKAAFVLQQTQVFQRAIFFTLLNPQPDGAGFAGIRTQTSLDLSSFKTIEMTCRGQGSNENYKVVLRHNGLHSDNDNTYEEFFTVDKSREEFSTVKLPLADFKAYFRGREIEDADPLNTSNITMFGLQIYGGVYLPLKQKGVSALEIETIIATS